MADGIKESDSEFNATVSAYFTEKGYEDRLPYWAPNIIGLVHNRLGVSSEVINWLDTPYGAYGITPTEALLFGDLSRAFAYAVTPDKFQNKNFTPVDAITRYLVMFQNYDEANDPDMKNPALWDGGIYLLPEPSVCLESLRLSIDEEIIKSTPLGPEVYLHRGQITQEQFDALREVLLSLDIDSSLEYTTNYVSSVVRDILGIS